MFLPFLMGFLLFFFPGLVVFSFFGLVFLFDRVDFILILTLKGCATFLLSFFKLVAGIDIHL